MTPSTLAPIRYDWRGATWDDLVRVEGLYVISMSDRSKSEMARHSARWIWEQIVAEIERRKREQAHG